MPAAAQTWAATTNRGATAYVIHNVKSREQSHLAVGVNMSFERPKLALSTDVIKVRRRRDGVDCVVWGCRASWTHGHCRGAWRVTTGQHSREHHQWLVAGVHPRRLPPGGLERQVGPPLLPLVLSSVVNPRVYWRFAVWVVPGGLVCLLCVLVVYARS